MISEWDKFRGYMAPVLRGRVRAARFRLRCLYGTRQGQGIVLEGVRRGCAHTCTGWRIGVHIATEGVYVATEAGAWVGTLTQRVSYYFFLHSVRLEADGGKEWG